jgi:hypothetical protein
MAASIMWEGPQCPDYLIIKPWPRIGNEIDSVSTACGPPFSLFDKPFGDWIFFDVVHNVAELLSSLH